MSIPTTKAWVISMVGGLFFTYFFMQMAFLNPIADAVTQYYELTPDQFGSLASAYLLAVALASLPAGVLTDKCAVRPLMLIVLATSILSLILMHFIHHYPALVALRFFQGLLHSFCLLAGLKLASQWIPAERMATASSLIITIGLLGGAITQPLFLYLNESFGVANTFLANAMIGVTLWVLFFTVIRDNPQASTHGSMSWKEFGHGLKKSLANHTNSTAGIYVCFLNLPIMIFGTSWGAIYLEHTFGITSTQASWVVSMVFFGLMAGSPLAGFISDTLRTRKQVLIWGAFATFFMFITLFMVKEPSATLLAVIFFSIGFISACQVTAYPMVAESNPPMFIGTATSVLATVLMLGNTLAQALFSQAVSLHTLITPETHLPIYTADSFTIAVWGLAIVLVIAGLMAFGFKESFRGRT